MLTETSVHPIAMSPEVEDPAIAALRRWLAGEDEALEEWLSDSTESPGERPLPSTGLASRPEDYSFHVLSLIRGEGT